MKAKLFHLPTIFVSIIVIFILIKFHSSKIFFILLKYMQRVFAIYFSRLYYISLPFVIHLQIVMNEIRAKQCLWAKCRSAGFIKCSRSSIRFNCIAMGCTAVKLIAQRCLCLVTVRDLYYRNTFERTDGSNDPSLENGLADVTLARA